ncbi:DUF1289 domain-containing protein [Amphritea japonica]|nr:DUF1289 domain-containing protein [Amphritea japonica]
MTNPQSDNTSKTANSPCTRNCCLNEKEICLGCYRSLEEILAWHTASEAERNKILTICQTRKHQHLPINLKTKS